MLYLDVKTDSSCFQLTGDIDLVKKNRAAYFFIEEEFDINESDSTIELLYDSIDDVEPILKLLKEIFEKYEIPHSDGPKILELLNSYYVESANFESFSKKAKGIWNNDLDVDEFTSFKESVIKHLPARNLYDLQFLAAYHMAFSQNACNFSVPGAGKTSVVYGAYAYLNNLPVHDPKHVNKLFVIGPLSCFGPWESEYKECFGKPVFSKRLSGGVNKEERRRHLLSVESIDATPELTLMSYQSVQYNLDDLLQYLIKPDHKVMIVLDEAHKIKNVDGGATADAVLSLAKHCSSRIVLTGTPIPNGFEDIYNLYKFIWPDKDLISFNVSQLKDMSSNQFDYRVDRLIDEISPFFIRIKKDDLGLPPFVNHEPIVVKMGAVQKEIYDFIEHNYMDYFISNNQGDEGSAITELTKARLIRLMQAATNPSLLIKPLNKYYADQGIGNALNIDDSEIINKVINYKSLEKTPAKYIEAEKLTKKLIGENQKVIIWGVFVENAKDLQKYFSDCNIQSELLIGEVPVENEKLPAYIKTREQIIKRFHDDDCPYKVIIANPFAVGESISLHKACHHAIYLERNFNAGNFIQSKDRIHRVGLKDTLTHYHYINSENSIDQTIHNRLIDKEERMLELIESREIPLISQNSNYHTDESDDIKAIIKDYVRRTSNI